MAYFPIQVTGATAQFPLMRTRRWRTLETRTPGGHASRGLQPEARRVHWQLDYVDLTDVEAAALAELFEQSRGGLKSFGFVDPLANLMQGSEQIGQGQWVVGSGLSVAAIGTDAPAVFRVTNSGQGGGSLGQNLALPPGREFCLSCWLLAGAGQSVRLRIGGRSRQVTSTETWQRVWFTAGGENAGSTFCGVELEAGGVASLHSIQLEQQSRTSGYRAGLTGGIYPETRFDQESLDLVASGPNRNAVRVKLVSRLTE